MSVTATLTLEPLELTRLAQILGCAEQEVEEELAPHASAALEEYVRMFLGERVFTRGSDIREYRLLLLMQHVFAGAIPDDHEVSALFQTTASESRTLIRSVLSKFQYDLAPGVAESVKRVVGHARRGADAAEWTVTIHSASLVESLNRLVEDIDGTLPPVARTSGTIASYQIKRSTYLKLCERLGVEVTDDPGD